MYQEGIISGCEMQMTVIYIILMYLINAVMIFFKSFIYLINYINYKTQLIPGIPSSTHQLMCKQTSLIIFFPFATIYIIEFFVCIVFNTRGQQNIHDHYART